MEPERKAAWDLFNNELLVQQLQVGQYSGTNKGMRLFHSKMCTSYEDAVLNGLANVPQPGSLRVDEIVDGKRHYADVTYPLYVDRYKGIEFLFICPTQSVDEMFNQLSIWFDKTITEAAPYDRNFALTLAAFRTVYALLHPFLDGNSRVKNSWTLLQFERFGKNYHHDILVSKNDYNIDRDSTLSKVEGQAPIALLEYMQLPLYNEKMNMFVMPKEVESPGDLRAFVYIPDLSWNLQKYDIQCAKKLGDFISRLKKGQVNAKVLEKCFGAYADAIYADWMLPQ